MALSNMLREPRREITESAVGILTLGAILVPVIGLDYLIAVALHLVPLPIGMLFGILIEMGGFMLIFSLLQLTHAIGDGVCTALENRGVQMRPRQRYGRADRC